PVAPGASVSTCGAALMVGAWARACWTASRTAANAMGLSMDIGVPPPGVTTADRTVATAGSCVRCARGARVLCRPAMQITPEVVAQHGLTPDEYQRILSVLGRAPNMVELGIFSAMWSEHCSYKSSRRFLKGFPTKGPRVLQGPGENAGVVDVGGGLAVAFKMESHNHPSYIEPYQGAATGVGGILRDVVTMGARPLASLHALHLGEPPPPQ